MLAANTVTVPSDGGPVILQMVVGINLTHLIGTLVYVGLEFVIPSALSTRNAGKGAGVGGIPLSG